MSLSRLIATIVAVLVCAGTATAEERLTLRIATEGAYPPFNMIGPDGTISGFDVDIANALCAQMHADCEIVAQEWDGLVPGLLAGKFDAIVASMTITEERRKVIAFTDRYYSTPLSLVARKDGDLASVEPAALAGKVIGVQGSTVQAEYAAQHYGSAGATLKLYPSQQDAALDLENGRTDAVISDRIQLMDWLAKDGAACCRMLGDLQGTDSEAGIALRQGEDALREKFNAALASIRADGTYHGIRARYFSFDIY